MEKKEMYVVPDVKVITVVVEKGFAGSDVWTPGGGTTGGGEE